MSGNRRIRIAIVGFLFIVGGCGTGATEVRPDGPAPSTATVTMSAAQFSPTTTEVAVGGTVKFVNSAGVLHDVDFGTPQLHIAAFDAGERSLTFPAAGTLSYHCNLHAGMEATLVVR